MTSIIELLDDFIGCQSEFVSGFQMQTFWLQCTNKFKYQLRTQIRSLNVPEVETNKPKNVLIFKAWNYCHVKNYKNEISPKVLSRLDLIMIEQLIDPYLLSKKSLILPKISILYLYLTCGLIEMA